MAGFAVSRHTRFGWPLMTAVYHAATASSAVGFPEADPSVPGSLAVGLSVAGSLGGGPSVAGSLAAGVFVAGFLSAAESVSFEHPVTPAAVTASTAPAIRRTVRWL
ncbi:hypothetical protein [Streptomyces sp. NPDC058045]|uniref:hypothetical protein n=1 Tax=Streptomyces sp. NPDC058045 TaxID=3346311 RepID=UPI0036EBA8F9